MNQESSTSNNTETKRELCLDNIDDNAPAVSTTTTTIQQPSTSNISDIETNAFNQVPDNDEDEDEDIVSLSDILKEREELESDAIAVLGGSDDKNCTFYQV